MKRPEPPTPSSTVRYHPRRPDAYSAGRQRKPVVFVCLDREAQAVCLAGDFNGWHPTSHPMQRQLDGAWRLEVDLPHGHHRYQFVVDGRPALDPRAQGITRTEQGERVSLIAVS